MKNLLKSKQGRGDRGGVGIGATIVATLQQFGIETELVSEYSGIRGTTVAVRPLKPARMKLFETFEPDLCFALSVSRVAISAPIRGSQHVGVFVPHLEPQLPPTTAEILPLCTTDGLLLGVAEDGTPVTHELTEHLYLYGGHTSELTHLVRLLVLQAIAAESPDDLQLITYDPHASLAIPEQLPYLLATGITDGRKLIMALKWLLKEVERRQAICTEHGVDSRTAYRELIKTATPGDEAYSPESMPRILVVLNGLAAALQSYPKELEALLVAALTRGATYGVTVVAADYYPSPVKMPKAILGLISARVAMFLPEHAATQAVLEETVSERLTSPGHGYYRRTPAQPALFFALPRDQRAYAEAGFEKLLEHYRYRTDASAPINLSDISYDESAIYGTAEDWDDVDDLLPEATRIVQKLQKASTSLLQRHLRVGYSRAARLIDLLEEGGVITAANPATGVRRIMGSHINQALISDTAYEDAMYKEAEEIVLASGKASTSYLQRRLRIGYSRAAELIDLLEARGIIGPQDGAKPRKVYGTDE